MWATAKCWVLTCLGGHSSRKVGQNPLLRRLRTRRSTPPKYSHHFMMFDSPYKWFLSSFGQTFWATNIFEYSSLGHRSNWQFGWCFSSRDRQRKGPRLVQGLPTASRRLYWGHQVLGIARAEVQVDGRTKPDVQVEPEQNDAENTTVGDVCNKNMRHVII